MDELARVTDARNIETPPRTDDDLSVNTSIRSPSSDDPTAEPHSDLQPSSEDEASKSYFWLRRSDQLFVGVLMGITLILGLVHWLRISDWGRQPIEIWRHESFKIDYKIDINRASWIEFAQLNGIGPKLAQRIVDSREQDGPFRSIDDLQRVHGIGPKKVDAMRPNLKPITELDSE